MIKPKLRFKADDGSQFPDWKEKKLNEIAVRVTRKNKDNVTDIPLTISSADGLIDQRNFFNKVIASKDMSGYYLLKNGEFAYNKSYSKGYDFGSIKRLDLYDEGALSTLYICFELNKNENSDFYQKYFDSLSWYPELQKICAEGARNHGLLNVPTNDFFQLKLCVPSSDKEQQKIADFLSTIDTVIEKQKETVSAWEECKKGVMQKLFSQEVRFKADDGSDFPEWEEKKLGEVADIYDGVHQTPEYVSSGVKFVSVENIESIYSTNKYITQKAFERDYKNNIPKKWDILMTRIGDVGRVALIDDDEQLAYYVSLALIRVSSDFVPQFFVQALRSDFFQAELWRNMLHTAYPKKINKQDIGKCKVKFPVSIAEQQKIADCLSSLDEVIEKQKATLSAWEELKKGLLQQMFV